MAGPNSFTWIEKPRLAAMSRPECAEDLAWLRGQGLDVLVSLTEEAPRRDWVNAAGVLVFHVPMEDMEAPSQDDLERSVSAVVKALDRGLGVAVHCGAGLGRTGTVLACYLVHQGLAPREAIARIRKLRSGSVETAEQEEAVAEYARRRKGAPE